MSRLTIKDKEVERWGNLLPKTNFAGDENIVGIQLAKAGYELALENEELTKQLKQSQNSKAIEVLKQVKETIIKNISPIIFQDSSWLGKQIVLDEIDNQITKLKGE